MLDELLVRSQRTFDDIERLLFRTAQLSEETQRHLRRLHRADGAEDGEKMSALVTRQQIQDCRDACERASR